jgi:hypothetical protein
MPEMFAYCGKRFRVFKRAHKTCDTIKSSVGRKMKDAVHLDHLRCDGEAHGGCQAMCLIFWKEAWLKRISANENGSAGSHRAAAAPKQSLEKTKCSEQCVLAETMLKKEPANGEPIYQCQATELLRATDPLPWWDIRQYIEDYTSGNVTARQLIVSGLHSAWYHLSEAGVGLGSLMRWLYDKFQSLRGGVPFPWRRGTIPVGARTPSSCLNLQPGEWARVKSYQEILATLDKNNRNRGMMFGPEEVPYCGGTYRVVRRVERIVDEKTGKMLHFKNSAIILEGAFCQSRYCEDRKFCPRAIFTYWREAWLERTDPQAKLPNELHGTPGK